MSSVILPGASSMSVSLCLTLPERVMFCSALLVKVSSINQPLLCWEGCLANWGMMIRSTEAGWHVVHKILVGGSSMIGFLLMNYKK